MLDLSRWVAGEYATKLFADFGADVIKIERPGGGSLTRSWGPFPNDEPDPERSALFLHLNTNKRSVVLDLHATDGRDTLLKLVRSADAVVESFRPGHLEALGLGPDVLLRTNPRLVVTRISAFGQTGPYRDWEATGITLQAMGGPMHCTGAAARAPQRKPGLLEHYSIGRTAGEATLAGLLAARRFGAGSVLDVSGQESLLSSADRRASYLLSVAYAGINAPRGLASAHRGGSTFTGKFRALDGYVMVYITRMTFWNRFVDLIADDDDFRRRFTDVAVLGDQRQDFVDHLGRWLSSRRKLDIMHEAQARRIPVTAFLGMEELFCDEHFRGRGAFATVEHPVAGRLDYVGAPWRMRNGYELRRAAPLLGEHTESVRAELVGKPVPRPIRGSAESLVPPGRRHPLRGIRIVDLTVVWAGPGATALLGDLGAEVIRVEGNDRTSRGISAATTRETLNRFSGWVTNTFPDRNPEPRAYDRLASFNWHARNKLAACMNLDQPEGLAAVLPLLAKSDVFVENNSNGVLEKLGIGHERLLELNPRLIVLRMPPMGMSGAMSDYLGYGPNFNALVGIAAMDGYEGENPISAGENYHMDEVSPTAAAFAVLAALWDRERTGVGGLVEFAQAENVMHDIGEFFLDWQVNGREPVIRGNSDPHVLQDAFPAGEDDRWVALSIRDDRDWTGFCAAVGRADWLNLGSSAAGRREHSAVLRKHIGEWTRARSADQIVATLQAHRVPVGEVMTETRLLADPHLRERAWFQERSHPAVGRYRYPGQPWRATGFDTVFGRPFPAFGEDNDYVYRELLGYSQARYDDLVSRNLVTTEQFA